MRVLQGTLPIAESRRRLAVLDPARTRAMLLLALASGAAALSADIYPAPLSALFCLLLGAACTLPLRLRAVHGLAGGAAAAVALSLGRVVSSALGLDSGSPAAAVWIGTAAGIVLLGACSALALWTSRALAGASLRWTDARPRNRLLGEPTILPREAGLERAEWELARAADYRRPLTLCLLGLDRRPGDEPQTADPGGDLAGTMRRIDQLLLRELARFEVAVEHGAGERLLVLPEVWAEGCVETTGELCALAGGRVGRTVRAALVTFPLDGTRAEALLADLELALERCRAGAALVAVGAVRRADAGVTDFAS